MNVVVYDPDLALRYWARLRKQAAVKARATVQARMQQCLVQAEAFIAESPECAKAAKRLTDATREKRLLTSGVAATEDIPPVNILGGEGPQELTDAEHLLLRKAFRVAVRLCHPDLGGDPEDFKALQLAYQLKDLKAVQEFVITKEKSVADQYGYWCMEILRPDVVWQRFASMSLAGQIAIQLQRKADPIVLAAAVTQALHDRTMLLLLEQINFQACQAFEAEPEDL